MLRRQLHDESILPDQTRNLNVRKRKSSDKESFKKYCLDNIAETTLTGIPPLITSKHWFRKLIKFIILIISMAAFLIQIQEFMELFWEYSAVSSIEKLNYLKKPAITICDENLIRRWYLCEKKPDMCPISQEKEQEGYCKGFSHYCLDPNDTYGRAPMNKIRNYPEEFLNINFTRDYGFQIQNDLLHCEWLSNKTSENEATSSITSTSCGKPEFVRGINEDSLPGACYTLNPSAHTFNKEMARGSELRIIARWRTADFIIKFKIDSSSLPGDRTYMIAFHHPGHISNPFSEGFRIKHGKRYSIKVTQVDTVRLPPPYPTKCFDYEKQWKKNQFKGPVRKEDCEATCEIGVKFKAFGCIPRTLNYPHDKILCTVQNDYDPKLKAKLQKCSEKCREACTDTHYLEEIKISDMIDTETGSSFRVLLSTNLRIKNYDTPTVSVLDISFDALKSKTVVYKPKYMSVELFSYIGGYLGLWVGWTLLSMFDFVEIILDLCMYPFTQRREKKLVKPLMIRSIC